MRIKWLKQCAWSSALPSESSLANGRAHSVSCCQLLSKLLSYLCLGKHLSASPGLFLTQLSAYSCALEQQRRSSNAILWMEATNKHRACQLATHCKSGDGMMRTGQGWHSQAGLHTQQWTVSYGTCTEPTTPYPKLIRCGPVPSATHRP